MMMANSAEFLFSRLPSGHQPLRRRDPVVDTKVVEVHRDIDGTGLGDFAIHSFKRNIVWVRRAVAVAVVRQTKGAATFEIDREFEFADERGFLSCLDLMAGSCADLLYGFEPHWPSSEYHLDVDLRVHDIPYDMKVSSETGENSVFDIPKDWRMTGDDGHLHPIFRRRLFQGTIWSSLPRYGHDLGTDERSSLLVGLDARQSESAEARLDRFETGVRMVLGRISAI